MKLLSIITFFLLFSVSIFANDISYKRIEITYTLEKKHINSIHRTLKKMDITMYVDNKNKKYIIYSKKYSLDDAKIDIDLKIIQTKFKSAKIITHISSTENDNKAKEEIKDKNSFNINLSAGSSNISSKQDYDFNKEYVLNYELEFAYLFNENTSLSLSYINTSQSEIDIHNVCASLNYTFHPTQDFYILLGLLGGYSTLEFDNGQNTKQSTSILIGIKNRLGYKITDNFDLFIQYNGIYFEHIVFVESTSQDVIFNYINNVTIGIGMRF